jgi:3-isopropylmalate dehydrogenase
MLTLRIHGSAPDIAGQGIANPIGTILSVAMLLRYSLGRGAEAELIEKAVARVFEDGLRTKDLGGSSGTKEVGDKVVAVLEEMMKK